MEYKNKNQQNYYKYSIYLVPRTQKIFFLDRTDYMTKPWINLLQMERIMSNENEMNDDNKSALELSLYKYR